MCLMHFGEWGKKRLKKFDKGWTFFSFFFKFGFENHLKSWTYMSHYKNYFSNDFTENFSRIFQKFCFFRIRLIKSIFQPIKMWRRKSVFQLKVSGPLDSFPIPFDQSNLSSCTFRFLTDSSRTIGFRFLKTYSNYIWFFQKFFVFLSDSSLDPFSQIFFFFGHFLGQSFKGFLPNPKVRHFFPFFLIILHVFMHLFRDFRIFKNLGFWCFLAFWSKLNHGFLLMHHINMIHML